MEGPPYKWKRQDIDDNMRVLDRSYAYARTEYDPLSIMKYYYDPWMYIKGEDSHCYSKQENYVLSEMDKLAAEEAYPFFDDATKQDSELDDPPVGESGGYGKTVSRSVYRILKFWC